jgi:hypothetical protein
VRDGGRSYRGKPSHAIPVWNGILEHQDRMGIAIWTYLWCLDRITYERDGVGYVLGGAPVKIEEIARERRRSVRSIRRDLDRLRGRYLRLQWTPFGYVIHVLNSRKFGLWRPWNSPARSGQAQANLAGLLARSGRSKEDPAVDPAEKQQQTAAAASPNLEAWTGIGLDQPVGDPAFRQFWETSWATKNGHPLSVVMGNAADGWEAAGGTVPGPFFVRLKAIRQQEKAATENQLAPVYGPRRPAVML